MSAEGIHAAQNGVDWRNENCTTKLQTREAPRVKASSTSRRQIIS